MAELTIYLDDNTIRSGNIEKVKRTIEPIIENSAMIRRYEASISLSFSGPHERRLGLLDLEKKLAEPEYKHWFRELDAEVPALPYFFAVEEGKSSLLFYLMGVLDYRVVETKIVFNSTAALRYFSQKKTEIKNLCLANNIDPTPSIKRLADILCPAADARRRTTPDSGPEQTALFPDDASAKTAKSARGAAASAGSRTSVPQEPAAPRNEETQPLRTLLNRFGSIAVFKENRMTKLFLVFEDTPTHIRLLRNELVHDLSRDRWYFRTLFQTDTGERTVEALLLYRPAEVVESIAAHGGVLVVCITPDTTGSYQKLFEIEEPFSTTVVKEDGTTPTAGEVSPVQGENEEPKPSPDPRDERIAELESEVARLKKVIEAYEEAMLNRQKKSILRKFFG